MAQPLKNAPSLYERDFHEWTRDQGRAVAERRIADIDWANVAEEIESLGRSDKHAIRSFMRNLLQHLAKWEHQPEKRKYGWKATIDEARIRIDAIIEDSPSLRDHPRETMEWAWRHGRRAAALEMRRPLESFPELCPYGIEDVLDVAFWPGVEWTEDTVADES